MRSLFLVSALALSLAACGGGGTTSGPTTGGIVVGGTTGGTGGTGGSSALLPLTTANYQAAVQEVVSAAFLVTNTSALLTRTQLAPAGGLLSKAQQLVLAAPALLQQSALPLAATISVDAPCEGGGVLQVRIDDQAGNTRLETGDSIQFFAINCVLGGETLNGRIGIVFDTVVGDAFTTVYSASTTVTLTNLQSATAASSETASGTFRLGIESRSRYNLTTSISASQITSTSVVGNIGITRTLSNYSANTVLASTPAPYTESILSSATLVSSAQGSLGLMLVTNTPFLRNGTNIYPGSGQATITGAGGSRVRVTAQDAATVLLELDANGDGAYETRTTRGWSQLL